MVIDIYIASNLVKKKKVMLRKIDFSLVVIRLGYDSFHLNDFEDWMFEIYSNPICDFHYGETYFIHILDENGKVFVIIPIILESLAVCIEQMGDCYFKLMTESGKLNNIFINSFIGFYISKDVFEKKDFDSIINELDNSNYELEKLIADLKKDSGVFNN